MIVSLGALQSEELRPQSHPCQEMRDAFLSAGRVQDKHVHDVVWEYLLQEGLFAEWGGEDAETVVVNAMRLHETPENLKAWPTHHKGHFGTCVYNVERMLGKEEGQMMANLLAQLSKTLTAAAAKKRGG